MKIRNGDTPIQLPEIVRAGDAITARWANGMRSALQRLRDRQPVVSGHYVNTRQLRFDCTLYFVPNTSPQEYKVTVSDGRVCELNRTAGKDTQAITLHEANNRLTAGELTEFGMTMNQAIYVYVPEDANGAVILGDVAITVDTADKKSLNYIPTVQGGEYYYKLAELKTIDGVARLKPFLMGSNIYHETGLTADYRVMSCPDPVDPESYPQTQHSRLRFCSGRLAGIDEDVAIVPLSDNVTEFNVEVCT